MAPPREPTDTVKPTPALIAAEMLSPSTSPPYWIAALINSLTPGMDWPPTVMRPAPPGEREKFDVWMPVISPSRYTTYGWAACVPRMPGSR
ncbi:Uncharacterised protein [Mycobacteroides abscessus subsp. abscessus]|nr:Uncharacterised protein [Mycobacteroides abscessus subsp. abscessus]SHZ75319.1 Uncharacterised protein [Mycobacteroides abscessus subsp. abscessus]